MVQTIFAGAADADERPGNMLKIDRKIFAAEMQIGVMGAVPVYGHLPLCKPFCILCNGSKMLSYIRPLFRYRRTRP